MARLFGQKTLFSRLVTIISGLTLSIVVLFTGATLLLTYAFEDVLFNERLKQAHAKLILGETLPYDIQLINEQSSFHPDLMQTLRTEEAANKMGYGEFSIDQRRYHYLITDEGTVYI